MSFQIICYIVQIMRYLTGVFFLETSVGHCIKSSEDLDTQK